MPPALPERFRLEVRLGRDDDIEEWLATDLSLDRPVLIRFLGPESSPPRRHAFVEAVRMASTVGHPHLAAVYLAEETADTAYSVSEWTGGATLAARLEAGETIDPEEFLPNAAGLAAALAELHEAGVVHGGIDPSAITYTVAHPAKLGAFGRRHRGATTHDDVRSLSEALEESLTGAAPGTIPPSEMIDGLSPVIDEILRSGRRGTIAARTLSEAFAGAPTPRRPRPESPRPSRRLLMVAVGLVLAAAALVGLGRLFTPEGLPVAPPGRGADSPPPITTVPAAATTTTQAALPPVVASNPETFDPYGEGGENDDLVDLILDGDLATAWQTEVYLDPLPLLKPGVGVTVRVSGTPRVMDLLGLGAGAALELRWAPQRLPLPEDYELIARIASQRGATTVRLPPRSGGTWLIWFVELPSRNGDYQASISELRFRP